MTTQVATAPTEVKNIGWSVTLAGTGINLALGVLYAWSVFGKRIPEEWGWSGLDKSLPYAICCLVFSLAMVPAGRMQDKLGPAKTAALGGLLVGAGMIIASQSTSVMGYALGFGVLVGAGIGFGYASATPPAIRWFPAARTGMIAGIVVSGFGLASVYISPLAKTLIGAYGISTAVMIFGIAFLIVVTLLATRLKAPPAGYVPPGSKPVVANKVSSGADFAPSQMLRTRQFYLLWFLYACGAGAGLMIIGKLDPIAKIQVNLELGFMLVAVLAIGNGAGRIIAGMLSDKIGRRATLSLCFFMQAILILLLSLATENNVLGGVGLMAVIAALIGANYGANLAIFPSLTKDYYGAKNFGSNYGLVFTSWGVGGFILALLAGWVYDASKAGVSLGEYMGKLFSGETIPVAEGAVGSFAFAYYCSMVLLVIAAVLSFTLKPPQAPAKA